MKIITMTMEKLTPATIRMHNSVEGYACNKTIFLLQEHIQGYNKDVETWTILHYERDRFGLLNGLIYLMKSRRLCCLEAFFPENNNHDSWFIKFYDTMTFTEISKEIDRLYIPITTK